jgi:hypothetical protein
MRFSFTPETREQLTKLRQDHLSMQKCADIIGCSQTAVYHELYPEKKVSRAKPKQEVKKPKLSLLPLHVLHGSCVLRKKINPDHRNAPQLTKEQMYYDLAKAVRNTARL